MTDVESFLSPLIHGAEFEIAKAGLRGIGRSLGGSRSAGTKPGRHGSHLVHVLRVGDGIILHRRVFPEEGDTRIVVEAGRPANLPEAAKLGSLMICGLRSGTDITLAVEQPDGSALNSRELRDRIAAWSSRFTGKASPGWLIAPSLRHHGVDVRLQASNGESRLPIYRLPDLVSHAYSSVFDLPEKAGQQMFADLVGAPDYDAAAGAFAAGSMAGTSEEATASALAALTAHNPES